MAEGQTYEEIASDTGYDADYIRHIGCHVWQLLSEVFGEQVTKKNFRSILKQQMSREDTKTLEHKDSYENSRIRLWDVATGEGVQILEDHLGEELQIYRPNGERFATYVEIPQRLEQAEARVARLAESLRTAGIDP